MDIKTLRKIAKNAAKLGIKRLKTAEFEIELADRAIDLALTTSVRVPKGASSDELAKALGGSDLPPDSEMLFHSTPIRVEERKPESAAMAGIPLGPAKAAPVTAALAHEGKARRAPRGKA